MNSKKMRQLCLQYSNFSLSISLLGTILSSVQSHKGTQSELPHGKNIYLFFLIGDGWGVNVRKRFSPIYSSNVHCKFSPEFAITVWKSWASSWAVTRDTLAVGHRTKYIFVILILGLGIACNMITGWLVNANITTLYHPWKGIPGREVERIRVLLHLRF